MTEEAPSQPSPRTYTLSTVITVALFALGLGLGMGFALGRAPRMAEKRPPVTDTIEEPAEKEPGPR